MKRYLPTRHMLIVAGLAGVIVGALHGVAYVVGSSGLSNLAWSLTAVPLYQLFGSYLHQIGAACDSLFSRFDGAN